VKMLSEHYGTEAIHSIITLSCPKCGKRVQVFE
jgi:hypothetical protein